MQKAFLAGKCELAMQHLRTKMTEDPALPGEPSPSPALPFLWPCSSFPRCSAADAGGSASPNTAWGGLSTPSWQGTQPLWSLLGEPHSTGMPLGTARHNQISVPSVKQASFHSRMGMGS